MAYSTAIESCVCVYEKDGSLDFKISFQFLREHYTESLIDSGGLGVKGSDLFGG